MSKEARHTRGLKSKSVKPCPDCKGEAEAKKKCKRCKGTGVAAVKKHRD